MSISGSAVRNTLQLVLGIGSVAALGGLGLWIINARHGSLTDHVRAAAGGGTGPRDAADGAGAVTMQSGAQPAAVRDAADAAAAVVAQPVEVPRPPVTGDVRARVVEIATAEYLLGVTEDAGADRDSGGRIRTYRTAVTGGGEDPDVAEAWCADFVSWVWKEAGIPLGKGGRGQDFVPYLGKWAEQQDRYHARSGYTPQAGDLALFDWQGDGELDHVGIVVAVDGDSVTTIAGNEEDAIAQATRSISSGPIVAYVSPP